MVCFEEDPANDESVNFGEKLDSGSFRPRIVVRPKGRPMRMSCGQAGKTGEAAGQLPIALIRRGILPDFNALLGGCCGDDEQRRDEGQAFMDRVHLQVLFLQLPLQPLVCRS
jgi:hypothetical protein